MKRAQIFSMIAVLMSALFILLFSGLTHVALDRDVPIIKTDVLRLDGFIVDLSYYMDTIIDKVTYDVLVFTVDYLNTTPYYTNYTEVFASCFASGYFDDGGSFQDCSWSGENISFSYQLQPLLGNASDLYGVTIDYQFNNVTFRQFDAYTLEVNVSTIFTLSKPNLLWTVPVTRSRQIKFTGIIDPATRGTSYERTIQYAPGIGDLFQAGVIAGDTSRLAEFIDEGYYFRDRTGLSFLDTLEGKNLTNTTANNPFGINAFIPLTNTTGYSLYGGNQTSMVLYHYTSNLTFTNPDSLIRFADGRGINSSLIFHRLYVLDTLQFNDTSILLPVVDCCDAMGCDPACP